MTSGLLMVLIGAGLLSAAAPAAAQALPPRPTLTPAPKRSSGPTATPVPSGRITGTVIDSATGAPTSGVAVTVGDVVVTSDANGNYDRSGLPAGSYLVALALREGQGVAEQGPLTVALADGATVVQHLAFRSAPAPAAAAPAPAALPATADTGGPAHGATLVALGLALLAAAGLLRRRIA